MADCPDDWHIAPPHCPTCDAPDKRIAELEADLANRTNELVSARHNLGVEEAINRRITDEWEQYCRDVEAVVTEACKEGCPGGWPEIAKRLREREAQR